jgi:hypothetical protein
LKRTETEKRPREQERKKSHSFLCCTSMLNVVVEKDLRPRKQLSVASWHLWSWRWGCELGPCSYYPKKVMLFECDPYVLRSYLGKKTGVIGCDFQQIIGLSRSGKRSDWVISPTK